VSQGSAASMAASTAISAACQRAFCRWINSSASTRSGVSHRGQGTEHLVGCRLRLGWVEHADQPKRRLRQRYSYFALLDHTIPGRYVGARLSSESATWAAVNGLHVGLRATSAIRLGKAMDTRTTDRPKELAAVNERVHEARRDSM
jgi:anti-sigma factor RsiW